MSIQPDLTLLTSRLDRLVDELRAARQQLQALEFSQQTQALEQAAFAADPSLAPVQKTVGGGDPLRDALAAAKAELSRAATPVAEITDGTPVPHPTAATASLDTPRTEPPPLPEVWEPVLPKAHPPLEFFPETRRATGRSTQFQREAAAPAGPSALRECLEKLQLWPPSSGDNQEARLGAWWSKRVGALLAVISVVFFGIYLSRGTPPWVRFMELLAVSAGVAGLGLWLERKIEKFGAVVFAGGLAMIHFTAFAGYAVNAVKVIDQVPVAAGWQLASVALLVGAAVWRRSAAVATLGTGLGLATAFFARGGGLDEFALCSAWLLGAAGLVLAFGVLLAQPEGGALHRYVTVGRGAAAAAVVLTGLRGRLRPHRLLGLLGLALCIPRAFVMDLHTPLEHIAAFIALGGALLWVGFSYHKFRHLIVDEPEPANETTDNPKTEDKL
jgi:hypothetical protein